MGSRTSASSARRARRTSWSPKLGELTLTEPYVRRLAFTPEVALSLADYSRSTDDRER